jgi:parallel beta-helix repeat protein
VPTTESGPISLAQGQHDLIYRGVVFSGSSGGSGDSAALVRITNAANIQFIDCVFETNGTPGNAVHIWNDGQKGIHDISFLRCTFKPQQRMQIECNGSLGKSGPNGYHNISIIDCVFEPCGGEIISFDNRTTGNVSGDIVIRNNLLKGTGVYRSFPWHQAIELGNVYDVAMSGNVLQRPVGCWLNLSYSGVHRARIENNLFDSTLNTIGLPMDAAAQAIIGTMNDSLFANNVVRMDSGAGFFWLGGANNTVRNNRFEDLRAAGKSSYLRGFSNNLLDGNTFASSASPVLSFTSGSVNNTLTNTTWTTRGTRYSSDGTSSVSVN